MKINNDLDIPDWLKTTLQTEANLRLAVQDIEGQLTQNDLAEASNSSDAELVFERNFRKNTVNRRHRVTVDQSAGQINHQEWYRYTFEWLDSSQGTNELELILESPLSPSEASIGKELKITTKSLQALFDHPSIRRAGTARVAGLDNQKNQLLQFLEIDNTDWGLSNQAGVLLEGPPGTGKTELVIETCEELFGGLPITISGPEILSKWVGESERLLRKQFEEARNSPSQVLYIDEIDAIARSRSSITQEHSAQLVAQLLVLLDGINAKSGDEVKVIASTNLAKVLDPALLRPGRLGNQPITFPRPGILARQAIFHHYLEQIRRSQNGKLTSNLSDAVTDPIHSDVLMQFVESTEGYTGADIEDTIISAVTELQSENSEYNRPIEISDIHSQIAMRNIQPESLSFDDHRIPESMETIKSITVTGNAQIIQLPEASPDKDKVQAIIKGWRKHINDLDREGTLREVDATELLANQPSQMRDRIVSAFQHDSSNPLYLILTGISSIIRTADHTSLANMMLETMYDQLLQWDKTNLLIYESNDKESLALDHLEISD